MLLISTIWVSVLSAIYAQEVNNDIDGDLSSRILYGEKANIENFPYYAWLSYCGAAIISDQWLVTAAHCVKPFEQFELIDGNVWVGGEDFETSQHYRFNEVVVHPYYSNSLKISDIALLKLSQPLKFGNTVKPLTLPREEYEKNAIHSFAGHGNDESGYMTKQLMSVSLRTLEQDQCVSHLGLGVLYYDYYELDLFKREVLCTIRQPQGLPAGCFGDSGSPLVRNNTLVGIASFILNQNCHLTRVNYFTNVAPFVSWIKSVTGIE